MNRDAIFPSEQKKKYNQMKYSEQQTIRDHERSDVEAIRKSYADQIEAIRTDVNGKIRAVRSKSSELVDAASHVYHLHEESRNKYKKWYENDNDALGAFMGFLIAGSLMSALVFFCCSGCDYRDKKFLISSAGFIAIWVILGVFDLIAGIHKKQSKKEYEQLQQLKKEENARVNEETDSFNRDANERVRELERARDAEIKPVQEEYRRQISDCESKYLDLADSYDREFEEQSTRFAEALVESELIKQLAERISTIMKGRIESADRSSSIMSITLSQGINVYGNHIDIPEAETISFVRERIAAITQPLEIVGAAKALALQIQLNLEKAYEESPSGTATSIKYTVKTESDHAAVRFTYEEPNGKYQPLRSF